MADYHRWGTESIGSGTHVIHVIAYRARVQRLRRCTLAVPAHTDRRRTEAPVGKEFKKVLVPELNMGQLSKLVRADYLIDAIGFNKVQGRPFKVSELTTRISRALEG